MAMAIWGGLAYLQIVGCVKAAGSFLWANIAVKYMVAIAPEGTKQC